MILKWIMLRISRIELPTLAVWM